MGRLFEVGANSRLGAYSNKYGMHRGGEGTGKLVGGGMVCTNFCTSSGNIPYYLVLHTPKMAHMMGHPAPPQVTQSVFTTYEGNKTTGNFKPACTNSPVS